MPEAQAQLSAQKSLVTEDWAVVVLGFAIIIISVFGFLVPVPQFSWKSFDDLFATVLSVDNLVKILLQFLFVFVVALAGSFLTGKPIKSSLVVFPVVCVLTLIALILAGNSEIKSLNLEAVIFSLAVGLLIGNLVSSAGMVSCCFINGVICEDRTCVVRYGYNLWRHIEGRISRTDPGVDCGGKRLVFCLLALPQIKDR